MEWNKSMILHFISLIKQRPAMWDFPSPDYKNKRKRLEAVEEVGLLMGVTPSEVTTKWTILRNQYSREKRKITENRGNSPYTSKWYAYQAMDAVMGRHQRTKNDFWMQESKSDGEESSSSPPSPNASASNSQHSKKLGRQDNVTQVSSIYTQAIKAIKSIREAKYENTNDELTNYGLYIAGHLRKFSPPLQSRAKYEINKILYALDLESMGEFTSTEHNAEDEEISISKECKFDPLRSQKD